MNKPSQQIYLAGHGQTEWILSGQHTELPTFLLQL